MESTFVNQLASMQDSARNVEQELADVNRGIAKLKSKIHHVQVTKIAKIQNDIKQFHFDTLGNETKIFQLKLMKETILAEINYLQEKNYSSAFDDNNNNVADDENDDGNNNGIDSALKMNHVACHVCSSIVEVMNYLNTSNQLDANKNVNPRPVSAEDFQAALGR